jgi:hypothetical protein
LKIKIGLADQIAEARLHRDALANALPDKPHLRERLDRAEAGLLTLTVFEQYETEFRQFMAKQSKETA